MERTQGQIVPDEFHNLLVEATPKFYVTPALVGANVAYFALMVLFGVSPLFPDFGDLWRFGAIFGPMTFTGEWWRILSATFVHIGFIHLFLNMWALWSLGNLAERMFGNVTFLVIYLLSGIGGSVGTLLWHPYNTSAGASGAIFGMMGALLAFVHFGHIRVPPRMTSELKWVLLIVIGFNLMLGTAWERIDNAGHVGGLLVGLVLGSLLHRSLPDRRRSPLGLVGVPTVALALVGCGYAAKAFAADNPRMRLAEAFRSQIEEKPDEAREKLHEAIRMNPDLGAAHLQLGLLELEEEQYGEAADALARAIELDPDTDSERLRVLLGFAYMRVNRFAEASATLEKALDDEPDSPLVLSELGIAQHRSGDNDAAIVSLRRAAELETQNSEHRNRLALVLAVAGDRDGSLAAIEAALDLEPRAAHIWDSYGTVRLYREESAEAVEAYRKAVQLDPEEGIYHYNLSLALRATGEEKPADEERARAFELDPELTPPPDGAPLIWS